MKRMTTFGTLLFTVLIWTGCSDDSGSSDLSACDQVTCSGHGTCAVTASEQAICVCDPGYHAEDLDCTQTEPGQECDGVTCSGHGSCVVVQDDPAYPVCICEEGYHTEGSTNCVRDQGGGGLTCGQGTHEEDGVCVPDGDRPDDFCVPAPLDDPGQVVIDSGRSGWAPKLAWAGSRFIAFYQLGQDHHLLARTVELDGTVGQPLDLGAYDPDNMDPAAGDTDRVAVLVQSDSGPRQVLVLDGSATLVATVDAPENTRHVVPFGDAFALLHGDSLTLMDRDGTLGETQALAQGNAATLRAAAYDPDSNQLAYAYTWRSGDYDDNLTFALAAVSDFSVITEDAQYEEITDSTVSYSNPALAYSGGAYLLKFDAMLREEGVQLPVGGDTVLHGYLSDGTERTSEQTLGTNSMFMNQLIFPGRFALLLATLVANGPAFYWLLDATGKRYPTGLEARAISLDDKDSSSAAGAAYSDKGAAFLFVRRTDITQTEIVFSRIECL